MPLDPPKAPQRGRKPQQPYGHLMGRKPLVLKRKGKSLSAPSSVPLPPSNRTDQRLQHQALYGIEPLDWLMRRAYTKSARKLTTRRDRWKQLVSRRSTRTSSIWLDILLTGVKAWQISKPSSQIIIEISSLRYVWLTAAINLIFSTNCLYHHIF